MPEVLEWPDSALRRSSRLCAFGLAFGLFIYSFQIQAIEDAVPVVVPTAQVSADENSIVKKPVPSKSEIGADLLDKAEAKAEADDNAVVVDLGDAPDFFPQSKGAWTVPSEENGPAPSVRPRIAARSIDPEWPL